ncbi:DUF2513 domain-containing protein [Pseudomonas citronellolis]|uniref:DUF2513 domain-containing protein n=1 Tax=Pseudomonas citronellolis TaxID=53408 RepID=UPI003C2DCD28
MKRDKDLIRELLLAIENLDIPSPGSMYIYPGRFQLEGYDDQQILYHLKLIADAGYLQVSGKQQPIDGYMIQGLTNGGHDFADAIRDPDVWIKTKKGAEAAGGFTLDLLKDLAKGFIRKQIADRTGIEL